MFINTVSTIRLNQTFLNIIFLNGHYRNQKSVHYHNWDATKTGAFHIVLQILRHNNCKLFNTAQFISKFMNLQNENVSYE